MVPRTSEMRPLHAKWAFKTKTDADGNVERYKARMVACGNEQSFGEDYTLTFAAVMDMTTGKVILALSEIWGVPARHGDVPNAYVKTPTEPDLNIYLHVPQGMELNKKELQRLGVQHSEQVVLRLQRSLYGLKQAGRLWSQLLHSELLKAGFVQCITDTCLYYKVDSNGKTGVGVYVDDLLTTGTSQGRVDEIFALRSTLEIKDLGVVSKFLGMRINHTSNLGYEIDQETTIDEMLLKFGLQDTRPVTTPIGLDHDNDTRDVDPPLPKEIAVGGASVKTFQSIVGSLLWLARCTRPDIAYAVHRVTRRTYAPTTNDWQLAKRIARYLKGTKDVKFRLGPREGQRSSLVKLTSTSDADFAGDKIDRKSVSGAIFRVDSMIVGWTCRKQASVALSNMEAEVASASQAAQELLGLRELLAELGFEVELPMTMEMDNQAAIRQMENEESSARAKHIDIKLKFVKVYAKKGVVKPSFVPTDEMAADLLTKAFSAVRLQRLMSLCSLEHIKVKDKNKYLGDERTAP